jgi:hypothetical protein
MPPLPPGLRRLFLEFGPRTTVILVGAMLVTWIGGLVIGALLAPFTRELYRVLHAKDETSQARGFRHGGKYIGLLERLLIYLFVLCEQFSAVGFLIAAKSIFRFGELSDHQNRLEAEYITIGTLMSFAWGLAVSLIAKFIVESL